MDILPHEIVEWVDDVFGRRAAWIVAFAIVALTAAAVIWVISRLNKIGTVPIYFKWGQSLFKL